MTDPFARTEPPNRAADIRRIAFLAVIIAAAGAAWHFVRPVAVYHAARSSLGIPARTALLDAAINRTRPDLAIRTSFEQYVKTYWIPPAGVATWLIDPIMKYSAGRRILVPARHVFVDGCLDQCGQASSEFPFISAPYTDRDGRLIAVFQYAATVSQRVVIARALIRLGPKTNEIVGLFAIDTPSKPSGPRQIHSGWRDEDNDGIPDFVVLEKKFASKPQAGAWAETLAVARWNSAQTALRLVRVPSDGSVVFWTPPDGERFEFPRTAVIDDICRDLLPLPDGFGLPGFSPPVPASAPSTGPQP